MKTLLGAAALIVASAFMEAADAQHLRQPQLNDPERLRLIKECMEMNRKFNTDTYSRNGGREQMYHACMATRRHHG